MAPGLKTPRRGGSQVRPRAGANRPNPIKAIQDQEWRKQQERSRSLASSMSPPPPTQDPTKPRCPNKNCKNPNVVDGTCRSCGRVADDSNIVAEITFGETSQGAAVVQGSYIGPDQGGVRMSGGAGGRRIAGTNTSLEAREKALREARNVIISFGHQLNLPERISNSANQLYKLASSRNFTQGRPMQLVAAMCLYAACRKEQTCKIMLIDLADLVQHDVFHLGRMYKAFTGDIGAGSVYNPIFVEDLIYRFAARLEFGDQTNKVAETAIRLVQRMDRDWMVLGRRPSGICGACLIMAARMNNFRRTVREVVYIAKVTMFTLQQRLDEFAEVPSAKMTVEDFLMRDFIYDQMDPPAYYKKTAEYQAKLKEKRRKRKRELADDGDEERRVDADGFAIPAVPNGPTPPSSDGGDQPDIERGVLDVEASLEALAGRFGTGESGSATQDKTPGSSPKRPKKYPHGSSVRKKPKVEKPAYVTEEWDEDEELLEMEITENMMNPATTEGALRLANAQELAALKLFDGNAPAAAASSFPSSTTTPSSEQASLAAAGLIDPALRSKLDDPDVKEDEFADDPEVMYCLLSKEEAELKTQLWVNQNKDWMRSQQEKEFKAKVAAANPKSAKRRGGRGGDNEGGSRSKKLRIGEGQNGPADSATDATLEMMDRRQFSKRIDYEAVRSMLSTGGPGSVGGISAVTSRQTSRAGSASLGSVAGEGEDEEEGGEDGGDDEQEDDEGQADKDGVDGGEEGEDGDGDHAPDYDDDAEPDIDPFADD